MCCRIADLDGVCSCTRLTIMSPTPGSMKMDLKTPMFLDPSFVGGLGIS